MSFLSFNVHGFPILLAVDVNVESKNCQIPEAVDPGLWASGSNPLSWDTRQNARSTSAPYFSEKYRTACLGVSSRSCVTGSLASGLISMCD